MHGLREQIVEMVQNWGLPPWLVVFVISMIPIIELRGAIPVAWFLFGLPWYAALPIALVGNMLPVPFILLFIRPIFAWMKKKSKWLGNLVERLEKKAERNMDKVQRYEFWGLTLFVGIPLPGTGAWTGSLIAALMNMNFKRAMLSAFLGVILAGVIVTVLVYVLGWGIDQVAAEVAAG